MTRDGLRLPGQRGCGRGGAVEPDSCHAEATARRHPALSAQIASLPMFARYRVGDCRIGVVHSDADSLAGWRFDVDALDGLGAPDVACLGCAMCLPAPEGMCSPARIPACLHCAPSPTRGDGTLGWVANNGAWHAQLPC